MQAGNFLELHGTQFGRHCGGKKLESPFGLPLALYLLASIDEQPNLYPTFNSSNDRHQRSPPSAPQKPKRQIHLETSLDPSPSSIPRAPYFAALLARFHHSRNRCHAPAAMLFAPELTLQRRGIGHPQLSFTAAQGVDARKGGGGGRGEEVVGSP
ncbi:hypothetical protein KM043_009251 [Ampulex compressa]|nr:hypothetical protein KM043_009251 [Ampulex compressa]